MENYIKKWMQFALDNDYEPFYHEGDTVTLSELMEDKEFFTQWVNAKQHVILFTENIFIEAIARGIIKDKNDKTLYNLGILGKWMFGYSDELSNLSDAICTKQAIAIRDGELESFIQETLGNK